MTITIEVQEVNVVESLKSDIFEMDSELGGIGYTLETLWNIKTTLDELRVGMDNRDEKDVRAYFREDHRTIQMLQVLMHYTMTELEGYHKKAYEYQHSMAKKIMELNDKKAPAVTGAVS